MRKISLRFPISSTFKIFYLFSGFLMCVILLVNTICYSYYINTAAQPTTNQGNIMLIETSKLKAALFCSATKDIRYYLNGVLLRKRGNNFNLFSTDGHVAFCGNLGEIENDFTSDFDIIIPAEVVKQACQAKQTSIALVSALVSTGVEKYSLGNVLFTAIQGKFPDLSRIIPATTSGEVTQFQPAILKQVFDSLNAWCGSKKRTYKIQHNGEGTALIVGGDDVFCVAMPVIGVNCESDKPFSILI